MIERSDSEEVDALPVLAPEPSSQLPSVSRSVVPVVQTAAVAAGGFVAGAVVVGVLGRRHQRALVGRTSQRLSRRAGKRPARRKRGTSDLLEIVGSRSLLVDVHLLGAPIRSR